MQSKSTRAFRTISEAGDELGLQPHVLRFWESKFPQIQPMKRSGGRRFYRPEDIELIRGIKILLHREKHPIKDVQKLIRIKGPQSVVDLGRSVQKAATPKPVVDTALVPKRIKPIARPSEARPSEAPVVARPAVTPVEDQREDDRVIPFQRRAPEPVPASAPQPEPAAQGPAIDREALEGALARLRALRTRWESFS